VVWGADVEAVAVDVVAMLCDVGGDVSEEGSLVVGEVADVRLGEVPVVEKSEDDMVHNNGKKRSERAGV